jgi:uncharacterized protein (TIGR01777 family)
MRIAMTGASGLIGKALLQRLETEGHEVLRLVRRPVGPGEVRWDPYGGILDGSDRLEGIDTFIHLAGESIASRWSPARKKAIVESRVKGTALIAETLAVLRQKPKTFLCASAIGFYGDRGGEELTEGSRAGFGFLPESCQAWEAACDPAKKAGIRVVNLRTGIVLSPEGGALAQMLLPFKLGLGGVVGSGEQWMSWISLQDEISAFLHALKTPSLEGPVNLTAPAPVTNREFTKTLGKVLGRPTIFPLPAFMVKLIFGEMGQALLLEGQKVLPKKLGSSGFRFAHLELGIALQQVIKGR